MKYELTQRDLDEVRAEIYREAFEVAYDLADVHGGTLSKDEIQKQLGNLNMQLNEFRKERVH